jgi:hypothetical protein
MLISSNELMIMNSGNCFLLPLGYYPLAVFLSSFWLRVPKGKEEEEKKERRCVVLGINTLVFLYSFLYYSFIHSKIVIILLFLEFCKDNVYCVDD